MVLLALGHTKITRKINLDRQLTPFFSAVAMVVFVICQYVEAYHQKKTMARFEVEEVALRPRRNADIY